MDNYSFSDCSSLVKLKPETALNVFGLIILSTDLTTERDYKMVMPNGAFDYYVNRVAFSNPISKDGLLKLREGIIPCLKELLPEVNLKGVVFSCTAAGLLIGNDAIADLIHQIKPGAECITPLNAAVQVMNKMSYRNISVLTPYTDEINRHMFDYFKSQNIKITKFTRFGLSDDVEIARLEPESIIKALQTSDHGNADAIFCSCTGLRALEVIDEAEKRIGRPIISSNQATLFRCLNLAGYKQPITGYGALLENHSS